MPTNEEVRRKLREAVERVRADKDLSDAGRRKQIKAAYETAKSQLDANIRAEKQQREDARDTAYRALFGANAADQMSLRDAADRAAAVRGGPDMFGREMKKAHDRGDAILVAALAQQVADQAEAALLPQRRAKWDAILDEYAAVTNKTEHLTALRDTAGGSPTDRVLKSFDRFLPRPEELDQRIDDGDDAA